jgi:hypothetical protein
MRILNDELTLLWTPRYIGILTIPVSVHHRLD